MTRHKMAIAAALVAVGGAGLLTPMLGDSVFAYEMNGDFAVPVGETDEVRYNDLKSAIQDGKNVKLGSDISYFVQVANAPSIAIDHTMTLDLNGYVLDTASTSGGTNGNTSVAVTGEGTVLTILDSSEGGGGAVKYSHVGNTSPELIRVEAGAKLVLNSGSLVSPQGRANTREGFAVKLSSTGAFEMNGGKIESPAEYPAGYYGVAAMAAGSVKVTGGEINTNGTAIWLKSGAAVIDVSNAVIKSGQSDVIDVSSTTASGKINGVEVRRASIAGAVSLSGVTVSDSLTLKGGERTVEEVAVGGNLVVSGGTNNLANVIVNGLTTVSAGTTTVGGGVKLNGGVLYQSGYAAVLTIEDGATVGDFEQLGKTTSLSYTDKDTKVKFTSSYDTYGALVVNGGAFTGSFTTAKIEAIETANVARKEYVDSYNEHSGKTALSYVDVAVTPVINGGTFTVKPDESEVKEGFEPDLNEDGTGYAIYPKEIDMAENGAMESDGTKSGALYGNATFGQGVTADRKAYFELSALDEDKAGALTLDEAKGGDLVLSFDASLFDREDNVIEGVSGASVKIRVVLTEEQYNNLKKYDEIKVVYFDEDGVERERIEDVVLKAAEDGSYYVEFTTTHLSTYGVVGVNTVATSTPDTGTVTMQGSSAMSASVMTAIAVAVLTSIASFAYLIRRD